MKLENKNKYKKNTFSKIQVFPSKISNFDKLSYTFVSVLKRKISLLHTLDFKNILRCN